MVSIVLNDVTKSFGSTRVLHGIEAEIADGAFAVLVGPSGCGKSTLLRLLAGLEEVTTGEIWFGDKNVTEVPPRERDLAMVFQSYALYPHMTVRDNIAFGLKLRKLSASVIAGRVDEVAAMLGLEDLLDRYPRALSGGQRQRVAMGRAVAKQAGLFLFDEPLSNLDPALRNQVRVEIRRLHDQLGATSVYVTHDQVEAMTLADQLFVLDGGVVQQTGRPMDIYQRPANRFVASFVGSPSMNFLEGELAQGDGGLSVVLGSGSDGVAVAIEAPEQFTGLHPGDKVTAGIRPHDVELLGADSAPKSGFQTEVALVETLGPDIQLHATVAGQPFIACLDAGLGVERGAPVALRITDLHLFAADSGASLRSPSAP